MWVAPCLSDGLGNRLFQFAAAAGASAATERPLVFFLPRCGPSPHGAFATIFSLFPTVPIIETSAEWSEVLEDERGLYTYCPIGLRGEDPTVIRGYRQSPKYFEKIAIAPDWLNALGPQTAAIEAAAGLFSAAERKRTVALHVRLGDYRLLPHHHVDLSWYYIQALKKVPSGSRIHLFSDEPEVAAEHFAPLIASYGLQLSIAKKRSDVESLYEMSLCLGGTIAANSTFSWWGAYFAKANGAPFATLPSSMRPGMDPPKDVAADWMTVIDCEPPLEVRVLAP